MRRGRLLSPGGVEPPATDALIINERVQRAGGGLGWEEFASANPDLLTWRPSVLDRYYTPETLGSELARSVFLLPDR